MLIEIKSWLSGSVLYSCDCESLRDALVQGIKARRKP